MLAPTAPRQARPSDIDRLPPLAVRLRRPLLLSAAAVVGTLVVVGGWAAVIVGFFALVLVLERALPVDDTPRLAAELIFRRLARERRRAALRGRLRGRRAYERGLVYLSEDEGWVATAERRHLGLQAVPVDSIIGTVERQKAAAFDCRFRPPRWSRERWTAICLAAQHGTGLPPISVYRAGDRHFVRDGHHRVSVASGLGAMTIEADVVELRPSVTTSHPEGVTFYRFR
jgi:hypothetical protein